MKTLPTLLFVAALSALVLVPVSFEIAVSLFFAAGLAGIVASDYGYERHAAQRVGARARIAPGRERLGLAV